LWGIERNKRLFRVMERCRHCQNELTHIEGRRKKEFCNTTCRSNFWQKERRKGIKITDLNKQTQKVKDVTTPATKTNYSINTTIPPMPIREKDEDAFTFAARKNAWKEKHNQ
jgi:hypothetical protein